MDLGLKDKVAFIAGSTRGIGLAVARGFYHEGIKVVLTGRNNVDLEKAKDQFHGQDTSRILSVCGDMTNSEEIDRSIQLTLSTFGRLDVVVANVGTGRVQEGWDLSLKEWESVLHTNFLGGMCLARVTLPYLMKTRGSFTFISSIAGWEVTNAPISYSVAKAAIHHAVKSLSRKLGPLGVRVNAVVPGNVVFPGGSWDHLLKEKREYYENYIRSEVPLQRFGRPEEIADAIVFLASDRASFITGSCLVVDGGQTRSY